MAIFETAVALVLKNEGGLKESSTSDPGGITNFGISFRFLQGIPEDRLKKYGIFVCTHQVIRDLTKEQAILIYRSEFWALAPFEKIQNQLLANYIFDMCINHGMEQGIKLTQRAVWACQKKKDFIEDDGVLGKFTVQAINHCSFMLLTAMIAQRDGFYRRLVSLDSSRKENLNGWLNRCYQA